MPGGAVPLKKKKHYDLSRHTQRRVRMYTMGCGHPGALSSTLNHMHWVSHCRELGQLPAAALLFFPSRRRHTRLSCHWSSDVCSSDLSLLYFNADHVRQVVWGRVQEMSPL